MIRVGCCGWNYFNTNQLIGRDWRSRFKSRLQAYASMFDVLEVDSTFYKLPRIDTAKRWHDGVEEIDKNFEFIIKAPKEITHVHRFDEKSIPYLKKFIAVARAIKAGKLLFQTPASFTHSSDNLNLVDAFIDRVPKSYTKIWEPRGAWLTEGYRELIDFCKTNSVILSTDILRIKPEITQEFYYYRLHGFGKQMMYSYRFSDRELRTLKKLISDYAEEVDVYIMFNNSYMYDNALSFKRLV